MRDIYLEQLYTFGEPGRDPRTRVISVAYIALVSADKQDLRVSDESSDLRWFAVAVASPLAFDHDKIIAFRAGSCVASTLRWPSSCCPKSSRSSS